MDDIYVLTLLKKFIENNITEHEYRELKSIVINPEYEPVIKQFMDSVWDSPGNMALFTKLRSDAVYEKIIANKQFVAARNVNRRPLWHRPYYWKRIAASILLIAALTKTAQKIFFNSPAGITYSEYKTLPGERLKINLPDGSEVWLNAGSKIRFPKNFEGKSRDVQLDGEAFFDVLHDEKKPFKVYTGKVSTQVLGTAFNISTYKPQVVEVTVTRGLVCVQDEGRQLGMLSRNKQLDFNTVSKIVEEHVVDAGSYATWTNGELVLNDVSMEEAAIRISRWFNVKIIFKNPGLKKCRLVATFPGNVKFAQVMNIISRLNNFTYQVADKNVYLSGSGCK
jgi:transmembrane sensor